MTLVQEKNIWSENYSFATRRGISTIAVFGGWVLGILETRERAEKYSVLQMRFSLLVYVNGGAKKGVGMS